MDDEQAWQDRSESPVYDSSGDQQKPEHRDRCCKKEFDRLPPVQRECEDLTSRCTEHYDHAVPVLYKSLDEGFCGYQDDPGCV